MDLITLYSFCYIFHPITKTKFFLDRSFYHIIEFFFFLFSLCFLFSVSSFSSLFLYRNLFSQIYKNIVDKKNFNVVYISFDIWTARDKVRCRLYHALLARYLAIVYIDLLTKILGGISVVILLLKFNKSATQGWVLGGLVKVYG